MKNEEKILTLTINPGPLKEIIAGQKKEEYRSLSMHYCSLFCNKRIEGEFKGKFHVPWIEYGVSDEEKKETLIRKQSTDDYKKIDKIKLRNGYALDRPYIIISIKSIELNRFVNKMPEKLKVKKGDECFIIYINEIVSSGYLEKLK